MKQILILLILLPNIAFANLKSDLNTIIDWFYTGKEEGSEDLYTPDFEPVPDSAEFEAQIPEVLIPENPTVQDLVDYRKQLFTEEALLEEIESELRLYQSLNLEEQGVATEVENELFLLESQSQDYKEQIKISESTLNYIDRKLELLTREKSRLRVAYTIAEEDLKKFMLRRYIQRSSFGGGDGINVIKWIFSDKSASQIIEEEKQSRLKEEQKQKLIKQLWEIKNIMDQKEKEMAFLYARQNRLDADAKYRYAHLQGMTGDRETKLDSVSQSKKQRDSDIKILKAQQVQSTLKIQEIRTVLDKIQTQIESENPELLDVNTLEQVSFVWPVAEPITISAVFHDEVYEASLGKVHEGVDIAIEQGSDIYAVADGIVEKVEDGGFGYSFVTIKHEQEGRAIYSLYGHVSQILVREGQQIYQAELIAKSGGTPGTEGAGYWTTGAHLHLATFTDQGFLDPMELLPDLTEVQSE